MHCTVFIRTRWTRAKGLRPLSHRRELPKVAKGFTHCTSSCLHPSPLVQQQAPLSRPQPPDLIWMIKSFFFSLAQILVSPTPLLSGSHPTPSPIDRHTEEITLIAGITSPHVGWLHTGKGGGDCGEGGRVMCMMCKCIWGAFEGGGRVRHAKKKIWGLFLLSA